MNRIKLDKDFEAAKRELLEGKFLEYDEEWKNLFSWMRENITQENYVSPSMWENANNRRFDGEIEDIEKDFPGIFEVTEDDVAKAEKQLEALQIAEKEYREQSAEMGNILEMVNEELRELSKESADSYAQSEIWREKVEESEAELASLLEQKIDCVEKLRKMHKNPDETLAAAQIPMDLLNRNMSMAEKRLETCMTTFNTDESLELTQQLCGRIEFCAEDSLKRYDELLEARINVAGLESVIEMIDNFPESSLSTEEVNSQMAEMSQKTEILEMQIEELTTECVEGKKLELTREKREIFANIQEIKLQRAQNRMERLKEVDQFTGKFINLAEFVWILNQVDSKKMKHFLSILSKEEKSSMQDFVWNIDEERLESVVSNFSFQPQKTTVEFILNPNRNVQLMESLSNFRQIELSLKPLILGPGNTLVRMSPQTSHQLYFLDNLAKQNEAQLKQLKERFIKEYLEPKGSNKLWAYRRALWIWFLTQPKNVIKAIECASKEPSQKSKMKGLPGIRNKQ
ncbi:interaptin-like [Phlebotomus argentipes]|uniref:interaptin-like n=1 Tax=Phlebotomus argentipes TaxID=94469 RepID=UPI00289308EE|nr:interaptin-like [Phlebotomus argentipes]